MERFLIKNVKEDFSLFIFSSPKRGKIGMGLIGDVLIINERSFISRERKKERESAFCFVPWENFKALAANENIANKAFTLWVEPANRLFQFSSTCELIGKHIF